MVAQNDRRRVDPICQNRCVGIFQSNRCSERHGGYEMSELISRYSSHLANGTEQPVYFDDAKEPTFAAGIVDAYEAIYRADEGEQDDPRRGFAEALRRFF